MTSNYLQRMNRTRMKWIQLLGALLLFIAGLPAAAQDNQHAFDEVMKKVDDLLWYEKVGDIAEIKIPQGIINLEILSISFE